jgi:alpha-tubulin suppressor-like RCC1 family protein
MLALPSHHRITCVILSCALLAACADDEPKKRPTVDMAGDMSTAPDAAPDLDASADQADAAPEDMSEDLPDLAGDDMSPDMPADMDLDLCAGVDCGINGRCMAMGDAPACACDAGFVAQGLSCVPAPNAPSLDNLPAQQTNPPGAPGSFQLEASDPDGDALSFTLDADACAFDVTVDDAGLVAWTCPAQDAACEVIASVSDPGGLMDQDTLSITCAGEPPVITSTPPADAAEGALFEYAIVCTDPDGQPTTLTVAADDTCGGTLSGAAYRMVPGEMQGGMSCLLSVVCSDGGAIATQQAMVAVAESNGAPRFINLPISRDVPWGRTYTYQLNTADIDLPAQPLTTSLVSTDCTFPVHVAPDGMVSFTCAAAVETCAAQIMVSDGTDSAQSAMNISCYNTAPDIVGSLATSASEGVVSSRNIFCSDPNSDPITMSLTVNTCGATLTQIQGGVTVSFTPSELRGGTTCDLELTCDDTLAQTTRSATVTIAETNQPPSLTTPATSTAHTSQAGSFMAIASDADVPAQPLTLSISSTSCTFPINVAQGGQVSYTCGPNAQSCAVGVRVSDGSLNKTNTVAIQCTNAAPTASAVSVTPNPITTFGAPLTCDYTFNDPDGDTDHSTIQWLANGLLIGQGQGFTGYQPNDAIACAVTPNDGTSSGAAVTSATVTAPDVIRVGAGRAHSCALILGAVWCWGDNTYGQLGDNTTTSRALPKRVNGMNDEVDALVLGDDHTCVIKNGALWCWGRNQSGQLGVNTFTNYKTPVLPINAGVSAIAAGRAHTCAVVMGALKCWGDNFKGQLGDSSAFGRLAPVDVTGMDADVSAVTAGGDHACAIKAGALYCWGDNASSQFSDDARATIPAPVAIPSMGASVEAISAGRDHTCAIKAGALSCWGANTSGQLGDGSTSARPLPATVTGMTSGISAVSAGGDHTCAIASGALKCWGDNTEGQLGDSTRTQRTSPVNVTGMGADVSAVVAGAGHTCAVQADQLQCWGDNLAEQLGELRRPTLYAPVAIAAPTFSKIAGGESYSCGLSGDAVYCWGSNAFDTLGDASGPLGHAAPGPVTGLTSGVTAFSARDRHACAIKAGALYCWGWNFYGGYGNGSTSSSPTPVAIPAMAADVTAVAVGGQHTCAVKAGALYCWGNNTEGQLGDSTRTKSLTPGSVPGMSNNVTAVAAGHYNTCAIKAGALWCWGDNTSWSLGDGTTTDRDLPILPVGMESGVTDVKMGEVHTCAIQSGALKCWGNNGVGQLGNNTSASSTTPAYIPGFATGVTSLALGYSHTCVAHNGAAKCWGDNHDGQLGDPAAPSSSRVPVQVTGLSADITQVGAGINHSCAIQTSGQALCWGKNSGGQAGYDLTSAAAPRPVMF